VKIVVICDCLVFFQALVHDKKDSIPSCKKKKSVLVLMNVGSFRLPVW